MIYLFAEKLSEEKRTLWLQQKLTELTISESEIHNKTRSMRYPHVIYIMQVQWILPEMRQELKMLVRKFTTNLRQF